MKHLVALILLAGAVLDARAQTNRLSLAEANHIAFNRNWDLLAARSGIDAAQAQFLVTREFPNPAAALSTARIGDRENSTVLGNGVWERNYDSIAAVSQLIEIGGKRRDRQAAAQAGIAGARARFYDASRALEQGVTKAYVAALLAGQNARILNESAQMLRQERAIAQTRLKAGDLSVADEKQIENNADTFELQAKAAEAAAAQARISVEILLGIAEPRGNWTPADTLEELIANPPPTDQASTNAARADVLAAEADLSQAQASLKLQKAMRIPDPTITIGGEHNPPGGGPAEDTLLVGISFPLPLWNFNRGEIKAAQAAVAQNVYAVEKMKAQAALDLANARIGYDEAAQRLARYQNQILPRSQAVRVAVTFAYEKGADTLVDLLEAERADNDARLAAAQAQADTASALADLKAATEMINRQTIYQ